MFLWVHKLDVLAIKYQGFSTLNLLNAAKKKKKMYT